MHEAAFALKIIEEAMKHGNVKGITIEVGELAHVPMHDLVDYLKKSVPWHIEAHEKHSKVRCACGYVGRPKILERGHDYFFIQCPKCKEVPEKIVNGQDIKLVSVMVQ